MRLAAAAAAFVAALLPQVVLAQDCLDTDATVREPPPTFCCGPASALRLPLARQRHAHVPPPRGPGHGATPSPWREQHQIPAPTNLRRASSPATP